MRLSVIALDFDGTIAQHDAIEPSAVEAIAAARARGIVVLLVTGRILEELMRVAGPLQFVDGVVAENGAVLYSPASGRTGLLGPPVPPRYVAELRKRGLTFTEGRCLVDSDARDAPQLLQVIQALELPLTLIFNRGRVMSVPQGVSKATGLRAALKTLRLSLRNTVAVGDAENDYELLAPAEVGIAVAWGSLALQATADLVLPGHDPSATGPFLRHLIASGRLPEAAHGRRRLALGHLDDGTEFSLAVRGRNVLVTGDVRSGKSWVAGLLCEQLILHGYSVCAIDPEGDYGALEGLPGVSVLGGEDPPPTARELARALRYPDRSVVIDLSRLPHDEKYHYVRGILPALNTLRRRTGLPHRVLLDEAHYYLHDDEAEHLLDLDENGYTVVTYCASRLPESLLASTEVMIVTCESNPDELAALHARCTRCDAVDLSQWSVLARLRPGQAAALPVTAETGGAIRVFTVAGRLTPHVRHRDKYVDVPVHPARAFVFGGHGHWRRVRTLRQLVHELEHTPTTELQAYVARGDVSRWIADVFGDRALASELRALEARLPADACDQVVRDMAAAVRGRYDLTDEEPDLLR